MVMDRLSNTTNREATEARDKADEMHCQYTLEPSQSASQMGLFVDLFVGQVVNAITRNLMTFSFILSSQILGDEKNLLNFTSRDL